MELQRGVCSLCSESGKVFTSSSVGDFLKYLPRILYDNFLTKSEFQTIKDSLKVCSICCYKLELTNEIKKMMVKNTETNGFSDDVEIQCHFCKGTRCVMKVKDDWKYFLERTEDVLKLTDFPVNICYRCMFYFDTTFNFKTKLTYKFPQLAVLTKSQKSTQKQNDTPKRKSLSNSPTNSKKRKIFNNCFNYLQPLCNEDYNIGYKIKSDAKMYKKIAYVNLTDMEEMNKETPKVRPKIKIKLKQSSKKQGKDKFHKQKADASVKMKSIISQPYIKLCRSEEIPNIVQRAKEKRRSLSTKNTEEESEEKIDETPKAPSIANFAPKRRVSLYVELNNIDDAEAEIEGGKKTDSEKCIPEEEINNIVEKYIKDATFNETNKLELLQEIEENNDEVKVVEEPVPEKGVEEETIVQEQIQEEKVIEEEKPVEENSENIVDSEELNNKNNETDSELQTESEKTLTEVSSSEELLKTPEKSDSSNEGSDLDGSEGSKDNSNVEKDSLSGSERKKKRVTFSDEVNQ